MHAKKKANRRGSGDGKEEERLKKEDKGGIVSEGELG